MNKITAVVAAIHLCVNCMIYNTKLIMQTIDLKIPFGLGVRDFLVLSFLKLGFVNKVPCGIIYF
jgi:hypothetical protein